MIFISISGCVLLKVLLMSWVKRVKRLRVVSDTLNCTLCSLSIFEPSRYFLYFCIHLSTSVPIVVAWFMIAVSTFGADLCGMAPNWMSEITPTLIASAASFLATMASSNLPRQDRRLIGLYLPGVFRTLPFFG